MTASWRVSQDQRVPRFGYCLTERKAGVGEAMTYCSKTFLDTGGSGMEDGRWELAREKWARRRFQRV